MKKGQSISRLADRHVPSAFQHLVVYIFLGRPINIEPKCPIVNLNQMLEQIGLGNIFGFYDLHTRSIVCRNNGILQSQKRVG